AGRRRRRAQRRPARLPRRARPRRHRRLLLRGRRADPRHPDRNRHVTFASRTAYPEEESGGERRRGRGARMSLCEKCEELMQPYLDRVLTEAERLEAEAHLAACAWCEKR